MLIIKKNSTTISNLFLEGPFISTDYTKKYSLNVYINKIYSFGDESELVYYNDSNLTETLQAKSVINEDKILNNEKMFNNKETYNENTLNEEIECNTMRKDNCFVKIPFNLDIPLKIYSINFTQYKFQYRSFLISDTLTVKNTDYTFIVFPNLDSYPYVYNYVKRRFNVVLCLFEEFSEELFIKNVCDMKIL
ncbi:hypothetical protein NAPIS_ORF00766 [Vairimorpha apis BRL 01]|uniref:Uncharacterized protein n=1 Tax=Vairimorpha apis BRL 01 TaxID=1037528 RepID=T0MKX7_9MICR|nr:hypothetical protein NAPIS_ORF00766 [Vairimorpha apis BRL 01]